MGLGNIGIKEYNNFHFSHTFFLNFYNSVAISYKPFKFGVAILDTLTEGTMSQIFFI